MNQGLAIRSTFSRLTTSLQRVCDPAVAEKVQGVYVGVLKYIDYATECFRAAAEFAPYLHKRKSFDYEREVRAVCRLDGNLEWHRMGQHGSERIHHTGMLVACDLESLIEEVYISPVAPSYFRESVQGVCSRFGLDKPIKQSALPELPYLIHPRLRALRSLLDKST